MERVSRRKLLAAAGAASLPLAGCTNLVGSGSESVSDEGLTVSTLDVGGSPGGEMSVVPGDSPVFLDFFATWCLPCKDQMPELRELDQQFDDLHMLSITWEQDEKAIKEFWQKHDATWAVAQEPDQTVAQELDVKGTLPTTIVLDPLGEEVWRHSGKTDAETMAEHVTEARQ
jgi:thiol-disulfide isomerase/thioredoxin